MDNLFFNRKILSITKNEIQNILKKQKGISRSFIQSSPHGTNENAAKEYLNADFTDED